VDQFLVKDSFVARWLGVLCFLSLLTGLMAFGVIPNLALGLTRLLFCVYAALLAVTLVVAIVRA